MFWELEGKEREDTAALLLAARVTGQSRGAEQGSDPKVLTKGL